MTSERRVLEEGGHLQVANRGRGLAADGSKGPKARTPEEQVQKIFIRSSERAPGGREAAMAVKQHSRPRAPVSSNPEEHLHLDGRKVSPSCAQQEGAPRQRKRSA
jgi:hypothetical protein